MTRAFFQTAHDEPITLQEACAVFPRAKLTVSALRAEAERGRLTIFRLGRRDYTTVAAMREMVRKCQENAKVPDSISTQRAASGLSGTAPGSSALVALKALGAKPKGNLANT